jgi:beta-carotene/zeaxanthin 4-ketolase
MQGFSVQDEVKTKGIEVWLSPAIAAIIIGLWAASLSILFSLDLESIPLLGKVLLLLWQTLLYTGLFVTAHDAMHGAAFPLSRTINDRLGTIVLWLYGLFSYRELLHRHALHHQFPASNRDPDYFLGDGQGFWPWYLSFMTRYWSWKRFFALVVTFHLVHHFFGVAESNLAWGWVYPSVLSSLHLFYFGTYLPHRQPFLGYTDHHCSTTIPRPFVLSLLACYHFGYHHEHHAYTQIPWWQLPQVYRQVNFSGLGLHACKICKLPPTA